MSNTPQHWTKHRMVKPWPTGFDNRLSVIKPVPPKQPGKLTRLFETTPRLDMRLAYGASILFHIVAPIGLTLMALILMLLWNLTPFSKHKAEPPIRDLEFVLVPQSQPVQPPLNSNTLYRSTQNSRAGGKQILSRPISLSRVVVTPRPIKQAEETSPVQPVKPLPAAIVQPASDKPEESKTTPQAVADNTDSPLNPQQGDPNASAGVDAIKQVDFGSYMKDLQQRIRETWRPPRGNESKRVVVKFRVNREGKLEDATIKESSGEMIADQAALIAIRQTFPFKPLPPEFSREDVDIEFTFDYNVFGDRSRSQANNS